LVHVEEDPEFRDSDEYKLIESVKLAFHNFVDDFYMPWLDLKVVEWIRNGLEPTEGVLPFIHGDHQFCKQVESVFHLQ
jgi:hypothetical protein